MRDEMIPLTQAAQTALMSRERLIRLILTGRIEGRLVAGRWIVLAPSFDRFLAGRDFTPAA